MLSKTHTPHYCRSLTSTCPNHVAVDKRSGYEFILEETIDASNRAALPILKTVALFTAKGLVIRQERAVPTNLANVVENWAGPVA